MVTDAVATITLRTVNEMTAGITAAKAQLASLQGTVDAQTATWKKNEAQLAATSHAMLLMGAASIGVVAGTAAMAAKFSSDMELIRTQAGGSQKEVNNLSDSILKMAADVGTSPDQLAAGLYHIESAGIRGAQALRILKAAAEGAKVGHADLESVTNALVAITESHIGGVHGEIDAMAQLNAIVGAGNMRMNDLTAAMSTGILPMARATGISLQQLGAAIAVMTTNGVPAQDAATRLRMTLSLMEAPTTKAQKALESIGMSSRQLADDMRSHGLIFALQDLEAHLQKSGGDATQQAQIISHAFGGGRTSSAILTLLQNLDQLNGKYRQIGATANQFGSDWAATEKQTAEQWDKVRAQVDVLAIRIGQGLLPAVQSLLGAVVPVVTAMAEWAAAHPKLTNAILATGLAIGALGLAIKAYVIAMNIAKAATVEGTAAFTAVQLATKAWTAAQWLLNAALDANPIGIVIIAVAALAAGIIYAYTHSEAFRTVVNALAEAIGRKLLGALQILWDWLQKIGDIIGWMGHQFDRLNSVIEQTVVRVADLITKCRALQDAVKAVGNFFDWISGPIQHAGAALDLFASTAKTSSNVMEYGVEHGKKVAQNYSDIATAATRAATSARATGTTHSSVTQRMVSEAGTVESAWDRVGKKIAIVGLALAGVMAGGASAQGAAASSAIGSRTSAAISTSTVQIQADIAQTRASERGGTASVIENAGHGMGATADALGTSLYRFSQSVDKLPPTMAAAMQSVIAQYRQQIQTLDNQQAAAIRSEDQRHIQALQSIERTHEQALRDHATSIKQSIQQHTTSFNQSIASHTAAIRQANSDYEAKVKSIHDAYVQKLDGIHGKNAAERKQAAEEHYQRQLQAAEAAYKKRVEAEDAAIGKSKQSYDDFLSKQRQSNDDYITRQNQTYQNQITKEDQAHQKHLADLEKAFQAHAAAIEKALKAASTPTGMVQGLSSALQKDYDTALNQVTLDFLEHHSASQKDVAALKEAEAAQKKLSAAQWDAAFKAADTATKAQMLSARFQDLVTRAQTLASMQSAVQGARGTIAADLAQAQLDRLKAIETAITNQTAVLQASAAVTQADLQAQLTAITNATSLISAQSVVDQADATAQLAAIKDQTAVFQAQQAVVAASGAGQLAAIQDQKAVIAAQGDIAKAQWDIAHATTAASMAVAQANLRVGQDTLTVARDTAAANQAKAAQDVAIAQQQLQIARDTAAQNAAAAHADETIARDQLRAAQDTAAAGRIAAQWDQTLARDQLTIAQDQARAAAVAAQWQQRIDAAKVVVDRANLQLVIAQNRLQTDQLYRLTEIRDALGGVNEFGEKIQSDLTAIGDAQSAVASATTAYQTTQQQAAQVAQQWAITIAQDQQKAATDASQKAAAALVWQQTIARDQQTIAQDQAQKATTSLAWQQKLAQDQQTLAQDQANQTMSQQQYNTQIALDNNQLQRDQLLANQATAANTAQTNSLLSMSLTDMQRYFGNLTAAMRNLRSGVDYHWVGSGPDPFQSFINGAPAMFAGNPSYP